MHASSKALREALEHAFACQQNGDTTGAERSGKKALRKFPASFEALEFLGSLYAQQDRLTDAKDLLERALRINPKSSRALCTLGGVLSERGDYDGAIDRFQRALLLEPNSPEIHFNIGNTLSDLGKTEEAIASYGQAISMHSEFIEALRNRGILLHQIGRYGEALKSLNAALSLRRDLPTAVLTRAKTLLELGRFEDALVDFDKAVSLQPSNPEVHNVRGIALQKLGRLKDALASFQLATLLDANHAGAHWNESLCRLTMGDWSKESWAKYEWGWAVQRHPKRYFDQPLWLGEESIAGKTILLHDEQGLGDTIQFARFATSVAALGATVILQVQPSLKGIMGSLKGPCWLIADGEERPPFDYHCPLLSLPLALGITLDNLPQQASYLHANDNLVTQWQTRLSTSDLLRVGIVWSGSPTHKDDQKRSIPLRELLSLESAAIQFVSLQKDLREEDRQLLSEHPTVMHFEFELRDFSDTAALIMTMDLVISVSTAVAHLSAALGKPTWILLSDAPDWRWMRAREDTPWHPTAKLFRQPSGGSWSAVIERVRSELSQFHPAR